MDAEHTTDCGGPVRVGASGFEPLEVDSPMAKWKKPQPIEFIEQATRNYSFPNWQSGNEESIYYNLNLPEFLISLTLALRLFTCKSLTLRNRFVAVLGRIEIAIGPWAIMRQRCQ